MPRETEAESARRRVLAAWRRVDLTSAERAWADGGQRVDRVVAGVLERLRLDQRRAETEIVQVWNRLMDPHVASHAQPVGLRNGTLMVAVDSSVWLTELVRYRGRDVLRRLQTAFGSQMIRKISFRMG